MRSIARVQDGAIYLFRNQVDRAAAAMANDYRISTHGIQRHRCVDQRLALFGARLRRMHIDDIGTQPFARDFERQQSARAVLKKGIDDGQSAQPVVAFCSP